MPVTAGKPDYPQKLKVPEAYKKITESACARSCVFLLALSAKVMPASGTTSLTRVRAEFNSTELEPNSSPDIGKVRLQFNSSLSRV